MDSSAFNEAKKIGHEKNDLPLGPFFLALTGLIAAILVALFGLSFFMNTLASFQGSGGVVSNQSRLARKDYPAPQLQESPDGDLQAYQAAKTVELNSYGWVDRARGIVRVPIEQAMEQLVKNGIPVRPGKAGPTEIEMIQQKGVPIRSPDPRDAAKLVPGS